MSVFFLKKEGSSVCERCLLAGKKKRKKSKCLGFLLRLHNYPPLQFRRSLILFWCGAQLFLFALVLQSGGVSMGLALRMCSQR